MHAQEHFIRAVALLPEGVRERLDGDFPLDWNALEDAALADGIGEALRRGSRLPVPVEGLVRRLIQDVGVVPEDVAAGAERQGTSSAWIHWVTIEAEGESYQLRNDRSGEVFCGIRPEAIVGYATLGLELATTVHDTCERWLEAGESHRAAGESERGPLAACAVRMGAYLKALPETLSGRQTTSGLSRTLESAWNAQEFGVRSALARTRLSTARGARAPAPAYYLPAHGHRLRACDIGEIRWLRALAERAGAGVGAGPPEGSARETPPAGESGTGRAPALAGRIADNRSPPLGAVVATPASGTLVFGSDPAGLTPDAVLADVERVTERLSDAVRRRLGETFGAWVAEGIERLHSSTELDALRTQITTPGPEGGLPQWFEELATVVLRDTGAQTRAGRRTESLLLDPPRHSDRARRGIEARTREFGYLSALGVIEQVHLGLSFAHDASLGLAALRDAGKESRWGLNEAGGGHDQLSTSERETLEAAREVGQTLERARASRTGAGGAQRAPSALEQADMTARALKSVGPTHRTAAGWPGGEEAPDPRNPRDVARVVSVAESLHQEVRAITNRLIAGWVAEVQAFVPGRSS